MRVRLAADFGLAYSHAEKAMMQTTARSPYISRVSWGRLEVEGHPPFKDAKVYPGGARKWDWQETDTHHVPGIQPADVEELIERGARLWCFPRATGSGCRSVQRRSICWPSRVSPWRSCRPKPQCSGSMSYVSACQLAACSTRRVEGAVISSDRLHV